MTRPFAKLQSISSQESAVQRAQHYNRRYQRLTAEEQRAFPTGCAFAESWPEERRAAYDLLMYRIVEALMHREAWEALALRYGANPSRFAWSG